MEENAKPQKRLITRNKLGSPHVIIFYEGGGEMPKELSGYYTSHKEAQKAIDLYLIKKNKTNASSSEH